MKKFPKDFVWGTATSSYQIEGAHNLEGKGPSIWDAFCTIPGKVYQGHHGNTSIDHYHHYQEDVALMKKLGFNAYRFSLSWPRIIPDGKGKPNEAGLAFYDRLIDELITHDIEPWITLYHWDLPLALQLEEDGWLSPTIVDHFARYAELCFNRFGDRVKHWITLNEPWVVSILGHGQGVFAPGRVSNTEPYLAAHHLLLSHAKAVQIYREKYAHQGGKVGITNNGDWREPLTDKPEDKEAAERALLFFLGWFADPVYLGDYPEVMKARVGDRLPQFTEEEKALLKGSSDFFGLIHYTTMYAADQSGGNVKQDVYGNGGLSEDQDVILSRDKSWKLTAMNWAVVPWGCQKLLQWIHDRYDGPPIYITENGFAYEDQLKDGRVADTERLEGYKDYLLACQAAITDGVKLEGYFAWSMFDNFEWASGYRPRFGITYIDYETLERTPKDSAIWFGEVVRNNGI